MGIGYEDHIFVLHTYSIVYKIQRLQIDAAATRDCVGRVDRICRDW